MLFHNFQKVPPIFFLCPWISSVGAKIAPPNKKKCPTLPPLLYLNNYVFKRARQYDTKYKLQTLQDSEDIFYFFTISSHALPNRMVPS